MRILLDFFSNPALWIFIGIIFVVIYTNKEIDNYIDIRSIISNHYAIFGGSIIQKLFFTIIPLFFAIGFTLAQTVTKDIADCLNVVFSIFVAMFFSILSISLSILSNDGKIKEGKIEDEKYKKLIEQSNDTVIFEILLSVVLLFIILTYSLLPEDANNIIKVIFSVIIYYLTTSVLLNIFILIKRLKSIFDNFNK